MAEYIVKKTDEGFIVVRELVRCRECVLKDKDEKIPFLMNCNFLNKSMPGFGYCHLGERGENEAD